MIRFRILIVILLFSLQARSQPELPAMNLVTEKAFNILKCTVQFDGVRSIAVQRSADSIRNFITIATTNAPKKGLFSYIDKHPTVGMNYYRLSVIFAGDVEWFSNTYKVFLDSAILAKSLKESIETGTSKAKLPDPGSADSNTPSEEKSKNPKDFYYTPSSRVYTNPYTGHININLEDARTHKYSIRFLDPDKNEVLRISRATKSFLVLDKNNFNARGIYHFQLYDGTTLTETGYITIY
ncbi:MAG: hypothetical protein JNJ58_00520 [Chitinophagaceae bacterium]|nr:hypothetical protein [Chitinophagaceae bacterium]